MKRTFKKLASYAIASLCAVPLIASLNAATLASWDAWGDSTIPFGADNLTTGFTAEFANIDGGKTTLDLIDTANNAADTTFGSSLAGASDSEIASLRSTVASGLTAGEATFAINITNNTGFAYELNTLHLDYWGEGRFDLLSISYESNVIAEGTPLIVSNVGWRNLDATIDDAEGGVLSLANGETGTFVVTIFLTSQVGSRRAAFDNVAITGTQVVPEPSTIVLCGLGLVGLCLRRRRK